MLSTIKEKIQELIQNNSILSRLFLDAGWLLGASTVNTGFIFIQGVLLARYLGVENYGIFGLITIYVLTVNQLLDSRVWETVIKYVAKFKEENDLQRATATLKLCLFVDMTTGTLAFLIVLITAPLAANLLTKGIVDPILFQLFALSLLIQIPQDTASAVVRLNGNFNWLAYQSSIDTIIRLIGVIIVINVDGGLMGIVGVYILTTAVSTIIFFILSDKARKQLKLSSIRKSHIQQLQGYKREILKFLLVTNGNALLKLIRGTDTLIIGLILTPTDVGYYRVARNISALMHFPTMPLYTTSYPQFANLWHQNNKFMLRIIFKNLTKIALLIGVIGLGIILVLGNFIVTLTVGPEYLPAIPVLNWLALASALAISTIFIRPMALTTGFASLELKAVILGAVGQLVALFLLLNILGIVAAGIAHVVFHVIWLIILAKTIRFMWSSPKFVQILNTK